MASRNGISRRHVLAMSAAGGLSVATGVRASAQVVKRIDKLAPGLDNVISTSEPILELGTGFGGGGNTEGPVWWSDGGYLLFSSIGENRRIRYTPGKGTSVDKENTNGANGLTRDPQGRLVMCEGLTRRVTGSPQQPGLSDTHGVVRFPGSCEPERTGGEGLELPGG